MNSKKPPHDPPKHPRSAPATPAATPIELPLNAQALPIAMGALAASQVALASDPKSAQQIWQALVKTPGIGISMCDAGGQLLFVNETCSYLFSDSTQVEYLGKSIADFHPPAFVQERLALIQRVIQENRPCRIEHIYHGRRIVSTIWPIRDKMPPFDRVLVISQPGPNSLDALTLGDSIETVESSFIDLGPLNTLTRRELEVAILLGQGLTIPKVAATLHRSPKTIERHREAIGRKLSMRSQAELVHLITCMGLELKHANLERY